MRKKALVGLSEAANFHYSCIDFSLMILWIERLSGKKSLMTLYMDFLYWISSTSEPLESF